MSLIINNVECTGCEFFEFEAMYKRADGPDDCPECGSERKMSFKGFTFAIHGQGYGSFTPVDFGVMGKAETREDYDRCVKKIESRFPGHKVNIQGESNSQKQERLDGIRHRSYMEKKKNGYDDKMAKEFSAEEKILKKEAKVAKKQGAAK